MKRLRFLALSCLSPLFLRAESPPEVPKRVGTTEEFRQLLLATKWSWRNMDADVGDRECVFMADGTFRHPHFTAKFFITGLNEVELHTSHRKRKAVMTFDAAYKKYEAVDFENHRVTGKRL